MSAPHHQSPASSQQIAKKAKSNLAFALACLPAERRRDMISFYAFCRIIDDIADDPGPTLEERKATLAMWRSAVLGEEAQSSKLEARSSKLEYEGSKLEARSSKLEYEGSEAPAPSVPQPSTLNPQLPSAHQPSTINHQLTTDPVLAEVLRLPAKYNFSPDLLAEIIDGVASDQDTFRYPNIEALLAYCYKVASVVGLVSINIFGHKNAQCREYAIATGYALQLTNIMRDVGQDARESGRIYLPLDEMAAHGVTEAQILAGQDSAGFQALMARQYARARSYYDEAQRLLPPEDKRSMIASEMMAKIYREILEKLRRNNYPSLHRRERLHPLHKASILIGFTLRGWLGLL